MRELPKISYIQPEDPRLRKVVVGLVEALSGRKELERIYRDVLDCRDRGGDFFEAALRELDVDLEFDQAKLDQVPKNGPLVVVANHPFGVVDGIAICRLVALARGEFKILTNHVLCQEEAIDRYLLPIDFSPTKEAMRRNIETKHCATELLKNDGTVVIFPAGGVATAPNLFGTATDLGWKTFVAKLVQASQATVLPLYFYGQNSRAFQIASRLSYTLRTAFLLYEVRNKIGTTVKVEVGDPIENPALSDYRDRISLTRYLRQKTYELGGRSDWAIEPSFHYQEM
jgi:putative hemolysin